MTTKQVRALQPGDRVLTKWGEFETVKSAEKHRDGWWIYWTDDTASGGYKATELVQLEPVL